MEIIFLIILIIIGLFFGSRSDERDRIETEEIFESDRLYKKWMDKLGLKYYSYRFPLVDTDEEKNLLSRIDYEFNQLEDRKNYLSKIKVENPKSVEKLNREIEMYGDLIDENDEDFISRKNLIHNLKKEIISVEIEVERMKEEFNILKEKTINTFRQN